MAASFASASAWARASATIAAAAASASAAFFSKLASSADGLRAQLGGLREFVGDRGAARVEPFQDHAMHAEISEQA